MGPTYVASVLLTMTSKRETAKVAEVELEPIIPGAWAAWAKRQDAAQVARTDAIKSPTAVSIVSAAARP